MSSDNNTTENNSIPSQIIDNNNENFKHTSNEGMSNLNTLQTNTTTPAPQNNTFEFYLPLPNDRRIYHVTYTELDSSEIARFLNNNSINSSHVPDCQFPQQYNEQSVDYVDCQQDTIQQQSFDT